MAVHFQRHKSLETGQNARTIEVLDQRGIADRFLAEGKPMQVAGLVHVPPDISDFPTRHNYGLALWQKHFERIPADWIEELTIPIYRGCEVIGFVQGDTGSTLTCRTASLCGPNISSGAMADAAWSVKQLASHSPGGTRRLVT